MGDRRLRPRMTQDAVALQLIAAPARRPELRDEVLLQICRQTTHNHDRDSLRRGWELLAMCLEFFPPSAEFAPFLASHFSRHVRPPPHPLVSSWPPHIQISHYATVCRKRLEQV